MAASIKELGIDQFSVEDRLALLEEIWNSLADEMERAPLTEAQRNELERRLVAHKASPGDAIPWEEVKAKALARARQ
jgi:putative addiction module component (TIGR02574 family)